MIQWYQPTDKQRAEWAAWLAARPGHVRAIAQRFTPWTLYRLTSTGQRCSVIGFHEISDDDRAEIERSGCGVSNKPVTAYLHAEHPVLGAMSARNVYGIDPDDLVPWTYDDEPADAMPSDFGEERIACAH